MQQPDSAAGTGSTPSGHSPGPAGRSWLADRKDRLRGLRRILIFDIAGPLVAYSVLRSHGTSRVLALILSGVLPAIGVLIGFTYNAAWTWSGSSSSVACCSARSWVCIRTVPARCCWKARWWRHHSPSRRSAHCSPSGR